MIQTLQSYLVTKIKGIAGINPAGVFPYEEPTWSVYPAISITLKEGNAKWITNTQNEWHVLFTIRIYQDVTKLNIGIAQAEANLMSLIDLLITSFDSDMKLGNNDVYTKPISVVMGYVQDQPIRTVELTVECVDIIT